MKKKIAIIGHGYVGKAVEYGFNNSKNKIQLIDPNLYNNRVEDVEDPFVSFICVPTPSNSDNSIDASIVIDVVDKLIKMTTGLIAIKSTVIPPVVKRLSNKNSRVIYNPEFLTERTAFHDFLNPSMHVFGGYENETSILYNFYNTNTKCISAPAYFMSAEEASFVKYGINSFLATKVLWFNQYKDLIDSYGADYNTIRKAIGGDTRIGHTHTQVPGHDGKRGFGGACFPKDTSALTKIDSNLLSILRLVVNENNIYRGEYPIGEREKEQNITFN